MTVIHGWAECETLADGSRRVYVHDGWSPVVLTTPSQIHDLIRDLEFALRFHWPEDAG